MLNTVFPAAAHRYLSLPLFGTVVDGFTAWLVEQGYTRNSIRLMFTTVAFMDHFFQRHGIHAIEDLTPNDFRLCWKARHKAKKSGGGTINSMKRFLQHHKFLKAVDVSSIPNPIAVHLNAFCEHLQYVRGITPPVIHRYRRITAEFLTYVGYEKNPRVLKTINHSQIEGFIKKISQRVNRGTLQSVLAALRGYLRFLSTTHQCPPGLDSQIDSPRTYRMEQLPRSLSWDIVEKFLSSIDLTTLTGRRDFTMFFLIATYGFRSCEIVSLSLDDIDWRSKVIRIPQTKTRHLLELPLTPSAGTVLINYLKHFKHPVGCRKLFLRMRAPIGVLKPASVGTAFIFWSGRSGLAIPFQGAHCLRHSYAVHLLREGTPLKVIGDLLGHRSAESTSAYIRLSLEDLRDVGLTVPHLTKKINGVQS